MRVLVTGGAGFIGRHVVEALVAGGHEVRVLDALLPHVHPAGSPPAFPGGVEFRHGDLRDESTVVSALRGVDAVCHQAAMVGRGKEIRDAARYVTCNDLATARLVTAMTELGLGKLVLGSSVVIYGDSRYDCPVHGRVRPGRRPKEALDAGRFEVTCPECGLTVVDSPVEEDDPLDPPRNVYAITKLAQEHLAGAWARETGGQAVALRYHNVYGPEMPPGSPYSGVTAVFRTAVERGTAARVFEDGKPCRDFIHVRDIATANVAALTAANTGFRAFNVATGHPRSIAEVAAALAAAAGTPPPVITGEYRIGDVRHIVASPRRLKAELGWQPSIGFDEGMAEFARAPMRAPIPV
ncbi:NAD-dependent epimerase/dehydratase family protein [Amycolatopsis mediterranei]|uniref:NAD-dependent epimerase/dehydratase family protein n=1 Tax=Amycolatopsis mediterranei TaxID=33910 RepID=UPI003415DF1B